MSEKEGLREKGESEESDIKYIPGCGCCKYDYLIHNKYNNLNGSKVNIDYNITIRTIFTHI